MKSGKRSSFSCLEKTVVGGTESLWILKNKKKQMNKQTQQK